MTPLYCIANTKADWVRYVNEAFECRLKAHQSKRRSALECHFHAMRADALMKAARALETAMREAE
ncbi:hypothetical protein Pam5_47 [Pseudanabaena phage Pam5]|nr:hypothetical protein Pam5_47 [Pseudanabaena phage Pam5]